MLLGTKKPAPFADLTRHNTDSKQSDPNHKVRTANRQAQFPKSQLLGFSQHETIQRLRLLTTRVGALFVIFLCPPSSPSFWRFFRPHLESFATSIQLSLGMFFASSKFCCWHLSPLAHTISLVLDAQVVGDANIAFLDGHMEAVRRRWHYDCRAHLDSLRYRDANSWLPLRVIEEELPD